MKKDIIRFGRVVALELRLLSCRHPKLGRAANAVAWSLALFAVGIIIRHVA